MENQWMLRIIVLEMLLYKWRIGVRSGILWSICDGINGESAYVKGQSVINVIV